MYSIRKLRGFWTTEEGFNPVPTGVYRWTTDRRGWTKGERAYRVCRLRPGSWYVEATDAGEVREFFVPALTS